MSAALPMAVDARNLTYRYGSFTAVDDVTLQVRPGETMGLLGPNGAGKTTVVRMLCSADHALRDFLRRLEAVGFFYAAVAACRASPALSMLRAACSSAGAV